VCVLAPSLCGHCPGAGVGGCRAVLCVRGGIYSMGCVYIMSVWVLLRALLGHQSQWLPRNDRQECVLALCVGVGGTFTAWDT
jgi:hypothetical protein